MEASDLEGCIWKKSEGLCSRKAKEMYIVGLWKGIKKDWNLVSTKISFLEGNERK